MCCKPVVYKYVPEVILFSLTCRQLLRLQYFLTKYHDILFFHSPSHKCASTPESASKNTSQSLCICVSDLFIYFFPYQVQLNCRHKNCLITSCKTSTSQTGGLPSCTFSLVNGRFYSPCQAVNNTYVNSQCFLSGHVQLYLTVIQEILLFSSKPLSV